MGTTNKHVVRRLYHEVFEGGDFELAGELVDRDARDLADTQDRRGPERVKEVAAMLRAGFPDQTWEIHDLLAEGDQVLMHCTWRGTHDGPFMGMSPTHRRVKAHHMYLFRVVDGKVTEYRAVRDDLAMMGQLGMLPARH